MEPNELWELLTKNLVDAEIFTKETTPEDFMSILPMDTVQTFNQIAKSAQRSAVPKEEPMAPERDEIETEGLDAKVIEYIDQLEEATLELAKSLDEKDEAIAELTKRVEDAEAASDVDDDPEDIYKGMTPEAVEIFKAAEARLEKAEAALAEERHERMRRDYIAKAAAFDGVFDNLEEVADMLLAIDEQMPEVGAQLAKVLSVARERIEKGMLFAELGGDFADSGNAYEKATTIAKGLIDGDKIKTIEEARAIVWEDNPDLYDEYQAERRAASRR